MLQSPWTGPWLFAGTLMPRGRGSRERSWPATYAVFLQGGSRRRVPSPWSAAPFFWREARAPLCRMRDDFSQDTARVFGINPQRGIVGIKWDQIDDLAALLVEPLRS
jgi:hypothetical protein